MKQIGAYDGAGGNERWSLVEIYLGADPCEGVDACKGRRSDRVSAKVDIGDSARMGSMNSEK